MNIAYNADCQVWECKFEPKKKGDKHEVDASHSR